MQLSQRDIIRRATRELLGWRAVLEVHDATKIHRLESDCTIVTCSCRRVKCPYVELYQKACFALKTPLGTPLYHTKKYISRNEDGSEPRYNLRNRSRSRSQHTCARAWVEQVKPSGSASHLYYEGDSIFSYGSHFKIARLVNSPAGKRVALVTTRTYSQTTACHISLVRSALAFARVPMFGVPCLETGLKQHETNVRHLLDAAKGLSDKARRARKYGPMWRSQAARIRAEAKRYVKLFGVTL